MLLSILLVVLCFTYIMDVSTSSSGRYAHDEKKKDHDIIDVEIGCVYKKNKSS